MLQELSIRQFAIIDDIRISFDKGFTILSGETGAGKSIIINAVNLLLGSRASEKMIRTGAETAEVEAYFKVETGSQVEELLKYHGFSASDGLLIRRIISRTDRHRVYINDRLTTMQALKEVTQPLASISGQHAHQGLLKENQQLSILDQIGGLDSLREKIKDIHGNLLSGIKKHQELITSKDQQQERLELFRFQRQEILSAGIIPGEDTELEKEISRLKNAATLYEIVHGSIDTLYSSSGAVVERIMEIAKRLTQASRIDSELAQQAEILSENAYQIEDVVASLGTYLDRIQVDERRLEAVEDRLDTLIKLKRKYGGSLEAIIEKASFIERELTQAENLSENITETEQMLTDLRAKAASLGEDLSRQRHNVARRLAQTVEAELATLKMEQTRFKVDLIPVPVPTTPDPWLIFDDRLLTETGFETAHFLIAPNVGEDMKPMSDIASGGELSRIVLALKAILAQTDSVETVIFDEVDAGIGGTVAEVVGKKLANLSRFHQVICITHLPQIARFGDQHLKIAKKITGGRTATTIQLLNRLERIDEIARMLAGENVTAKTLAHATEMMTPVSDT